MDTRHMNSLRPKGRSEFTAMGLKINLDRLPDDTLDRLFCQSMIK